jgi:hypothetical protein
MVGVRVVTEWSLPILLERFHRDIEHKLETARQSFAHSSTKGDASEQVWLDMLRQYLPRRYTATKAHVVDSNGAFSQQIDVLVFDRQYSPFIFKFQGQEIVPAESVYAVFEAKQTVNAALINYAMNKAATVRGLHRTSLPIPTANGILPAKKPGHILAGILAFERLEAAAGRCAGESTETRRRSRSAGHGVHRSARNVHVGRCRGSYRRSSGEARHRISVGTHRATARTGHRADDRCARVREMAFG